MSKSLKTVLPLALLTCFALAGCDSRSKTDADPASEVGAEPATEKPAAPESQPPSGSQAQDGGASEAGADGKPANKGQQMLDQIKAFLQPDVIGPLLEENLANFQETLNGITDEASATAALPKLDEFSKIVNRVYTVSGMVPAESRPILAERLNAAAGPIKEATERLYANEDTAKVIRPIFMRAMRNFDQLLSRFPVESTDSEDSTIDAEAETADGAETEATEADPSE